MNDNILEDYQWDLLSDRIFKNWKSPEVQNHPMVHLLKKCKSRRSIPSGCFLIAEDYPLWVNSCYQAIKNGESTWEDTKGSIE